MRGSEIVEWLHGKEIKDIKRHVATLEGYIEELKIDANYYADKEDASSLQVVMEDINEYRQMYRVSRSYYDVLYFAYEYFSKERNPENQYTLIPAGVTIEDAPDFHIELTDMLNELAYNPVKKIGWGAPRGHAKSAYLTNIFPIHQILFKMREYIMIISETANMSESFLEFVANNLKENEKLRDDFGAVLSIGRDNKKDNASSFVTTTNIKVQASSMGSRIRGARFNNARPDLILCDDLESSQNTNTQDLRDKNLHWFNSVVVPIGDPDKTSIIYMGTLVHGQGLLPDILSRPEYQSRIYSSIVNEPDHIDLWHKVEDILKDSTNEDRLQDAKDFYNKNKGKMDKGVEVLWADRFPYFDLILKKIEVGSRAFASEYLNLPSDSETAVFKEEYFNHYRLDDLLNKGLNKKPYKGYEVVGFWDIAMGKNKRSDYNAVVMIAREFKTGQIYVLEAWAEKSSPSKAMAKAIDLIKKWSPTKFGVETISAQFEFYRQMQNALNQEALYFTRLIPVNPSSKKEERIESLEPLFEQGLIRTTENQRLLNDMLIQYPSHQHDDLPDALASALGLIRLAKKRAFYNKPEGL